MHIFVDMHFRLLYFLFTCLSFCTLACRSAKPATNTSTTDNSTHYNPNAAIISVILKAHKTDAGPAFEVGQVSVKDGVYKHNFRRSLPGYFKATFTDKAGHVIDSSLFENPLARRIEYPKESGDLNTGINNTADGSAYIRATYKNTISVLNIYDNNNKKLNTFNLETYIK